MEKTLFSEYLRTSYADNGGNPLPVEVSSFLKEKVFPDIIPQGWKMEGDASQPVYSNMGSKLATGYSGIYFTDFAIYLVVKPNMVVKKNLIQTTGNSAEQNSNVASFISYKAVDDDVDIKYQIRDGGIKSLPVNYYYFDIFNVATGTPLPSICTTTINENYSLVCQAVSCRGHYVDSISTEISKRYPAIKEEYEDICRSHDALGLLGNYQVFTINDEGTRGIVNIFCNMAMEGNRRYLGMNFNSMVNALYKLSVDAPEFKLIIPFRMGCESPEDWEKVHLMLNCRLRGKNVVLVIPQSESAPSNENKQISSTNMEKGKAAAESKKPEPHQRILNLNTNAAVFNGEKKQANKAPAENRMNTAKQMHRAIDKMDDETLFAIAKIVTAGKDKIIEISEEI